MSESKPKQGELFQAETTWFHVFTSMVENGDVAKLKPHAVTVYLVIKSYTNWSTGKAFPSVELISKKSGMSERQVITSLATLTEHGYLEKVKSGRHNIYTLREKVTFNDAEGRPAAVATWDYLPSTVKAARAELKKFMLTGENDGKIVFIENLNIQINNGDYNLNNNFSELSPKNAEALSRLRESMLKTQENAKNKKG